MGVLARRKSPQTSTASSARGWMDVGMVVGEAVVRAKRDVTRMARREVVCILAVLLFVFLVLLWELVVCRWKKNRRW